MHLRKATIALLSLVALQLLGSAGFVMASVSAQADPLVAVIIGQVNRNACEVTYRESEDENWGGQSLEGPPVACQGGLVTTYIVNQSDVSSQIARSAPNVQAQQVVQIPLTGNPAVDEAAISAQMIDIHEALDPGVAPVEASTQSAAKAAGDCHSGNKKQKRRADIKFQSYNVGAEIQAYVIYKRVNCARWKITDVEMTLTKPPTRDNVWFRDFMYQRVWVPTTNSYRIANAGLQCWKLKLGEKEHFRAGWEIQARSTAFIEAIDSFWLTPGEQASCWLGAGVSFSSGWFYLKGAVN